MQLGPRTLRLDATTLPRLDREAARFARALGAATRPELLEEARAHASALTRAPVEITAAHAALGALTRAGDVTLHLGCDDAVVTLGLDGRSALAVAARVLGIEAPEPSTGAVGARVEGAVAALAAAVLRRMGPTPRAFRPVDAGPPAPHLTVTAHALLGAEPIEVRVITRAATPASAEARVDLAALGDVPLTLGLVDATAIALTTAELAALSPGRALSLGRASLGERVLGLVPATSERGARVRLDASPGRPERVVLTGEAVDAPLAMDPDSSSPLDEALREAELVVRVELASVTLPVAAWAALREGDVVTTDAPVGGLVRLRAGGVAFAEGQLCELDGHLAVRVTRRAPTTRDR
ncbi:MAG: FliM/FliN family flagellar motor switch protein [Polyangiaceae bacterium]|nr:FliM/FliN family flagellar motor switch protein [Polyangiaceae bacterium]